MHTYSDEYINYWGEMFVMNNFQSTGIRFDEFLVLPKEYTEAITFELATPLQHDFYPLMRSQKKIQEHLDLEAEMDAEFERRGHVVELHGPRTIEPMHHRAPARKWKTGTSKRAASQ